MLQRFEIMVDLESLESSSVQKVIGLNDNPGKVASSLSCVAA